MGLGQIKKCVSGNRSENFRWVGTHIFFFWKKYNFVHFEGMLPFKMHKIIQFSKKSLKLLGVKVNLGRVRFP